MTSLFGPRVALVPVQDEHLDDLRVIHRTPAVRQRWGEPEPDWPPSDEDVVAFAVQLGGRTIGYLQYGQEHDPMYRHASVDLFLDPAVHGRGLGREAVVLVCRHLFDDLGHHRIVIDPAADNTAAIRCYAAAGFRPVGVMRRYERDPNGEDWHDGLLMDLLAGELAG